MSMFMFAVPLNTSSTKAFRRSLEATWRAGFGVEHPKSPLLTEEILAEIISSIVLLDDDDISLTCYHEEEVPTPRWQKQKKPVSALSINQFDQSVAVLFPFPS